MGWERTLVWMDVSIMTTSSETVALDVVRPRVVKKRPMAKASFDNRLQSETGPGGDVRPFGNDRVPGPQAAGDVVAPLVLAEPHEDHALPGLFGPADIPAPAAGIIEAVIGIARIGGAGLAVDLPAIGVARAFLQAENAAGGPGRDRQLPLDERGEETGLFERGNPERGGNPGAFEAVVAARIAGKVGIAVIETAGIGRQ